MQHIEVKIVENVATIAMDRAPVCNAIDSQMITDLTQAFSDVHQEKRVGAVVLTGKGKFFSSGADLKSLASIADLEPLEAQTEWLQFWRELTELCETLLRFPKPVVAAVDGPAIGAGLALALAADMIVLGTAGSLVANASHRGLIGGLTAPLLTFRFGAAVAARMLLTGMPMEAEEAHRLGMCCELVPSDQIWVAANTWAKHCTHGPREAMQATKRILNESIGEALMTQLSTGAATAATLCSTEAASEGIRAFIEKRPPQWP
ncbi:enoyl-CoA hydratase/isomerase family protein [Roseiconus nitratireducens]|uniref:Enoyl-CoA hydratase/isomerase family protein n=1 Tax=Roseiconus nitratireducens TaxID=2605748 RepID=A0A5M6DHG1_9BACT|nr:enoyl-CoA hydratase/isomerase family protein [Roseiconus nitratireducens]KAA5546974.1 enoyl-CoA hydratase/isomerase family protein [Roseiconus nitratireducens]